MDITNNIGTACGSTPQATSAGLYAVILAGGIGSRFWPLSRKVQPKQFLRFKDSGCLSRLTLLQDTVRRIQNLISLNNIFIVSNKNYASEIRRQISGFKIPLENILLEPQAKNTAPAIGLAARLILSQDPEAVLVILPSDHLISKESEFLKTLTRAKEIALSGYLVTIGITPYFAQTGYGYIKVRNQKPEARSNNIHTYKIERFIEKPDKKEAERFIKDKRYYWNSGIFICKADCLLGQFQKYLPTLYRKLRKIKKIDDIERIWQDLPTVSIDYGIMEKTRQIMMVAAKFNWRDLGSWQALDELLPKDKSGNTLEGNSLDLGSSNVTIFGDRRVIATIGLSDLIIVDTKDALLVCHKDKLQDVKKIVEGLKKRYLTQLI